VYVEDERSWSKKPVRAAEICGTGLALTTTGALWLSRRRQVRLRVSKRWLSFSSTSSSRKVASKSSTISGSWGGAAATVSSMAST